MYRWSKGAVASGVASIAATRSSGTGGRERAGASVACGPTCAFTIAKSERLCGRSRSRKLAWRAGFLQDEIHRLRPEFLDQAGPVIPIVPAEGDAHDRIQRGENPVVERSDADRVGQLGHHREDAKSAAPYPESRLGDDLVKDLQRNAPLAFGQPGAGAPPV